MKYTELISLLRNQDKKGLKMLYTEYGANLYDYAVSRWKFTEDEAWEVIYKTLETLLNKVHEYEFESQKHFENFLFKVFKNNLGQLYRTKKRNEENIRFLTMDQIQLVNDGDEEEWNANIPDSNILHDYFSDGLNENTSPLFKNLQAALEALKQNERDLLMLRAQNFSYREIAEMLGLEEKEEQLKVKYLRAKKKLIKQIERESKTKKTGNNG
jgi:RNA polymerase sigma-70 factor (ECF subfamily)